MSDTFNNILRKVTVGGIVTTVPGQLRSDPGFEFRSGPDPRLGGPVYMAILEEVVGRLSTGQAAFLGTRALVDTADGFGRAVLYA